ncbi:MAG: leucine-rich repeat protein [Ruminococcus sp.]|nr:leucine-rich repeat protein [Ruminococcus sp.]
MKKMHKSKSVTISIVSFLLVMVIGFIASSSVASAATQDKEYDLYKADVYSDVYAERFVVADSSSYARSFYSKVEKDVLFNIELALWADLKVIADFSHIQETISHKTYYETVLFDLLIGKYSDDYSDDFEGIMDNVTDSSNSFFISTAKYVLGPDKKVTAQNLKDAKITEESKKLLLEGTGLGNAATTASHVMELLNLYNNWYDAMKMVASYKELDDIVKGTDEVLRRISVNTDNCWELRTAAESMRKYIADAQESIFDGWKEGLFSFADDVLAEVLDKFVDWTWDKLAEGCPVLGDAVLAAQLTAKGGCVVVNLLMNEDEKTKAYYQLQANVGCEMALLDAIARLEVVYKNNPTESNATNYLRAIDMYESVVLMGFDYSVDLIEAIKDSFWYSIFGDKGDAELVIKQVESDKKEKANDFELFADKTYDAYKSIYQPDFDEIYDSFDDYDFSSRIEVTSIAFDKKEISLPMNIGTTVSAKTYPSNANFGTTVIYLSSDESVVEVGVFGEVTPVGPGTAYITASTATTGDVRMKVTVYPYEVKSVASGYCITDYCGDGGDVTIPSSIEGIPIVEIGDCAFSNGYKGNNITSIVIPKGVTTIGNRAFEYSLSLNDIVIPEGVTSIGKQAFYGCNSLKNVIIPEGVNIINSLTFYNCDSLISIVLPKSINYIGDSAFMCCRSLKNITIPDGVTYIGDGAFTECSCLTSVNIPQGVTFIGIGTFMNCYSLTSINIPSSVEYFSLEAFGYCESLETVELTYGITDIGLNTFVGCSKLKSIDIPASVTSIGNDVFFLCSSLTNINVSEENLYYSSVEGVLFNKDKSMLVKYPEGKPDTIYSIPLGVASFGYHAFANTFNLTHVEIPYGVIDIDIDCDFQDSSIVSLSIPSSVKNIRNHRPDFCLDFLEVYYVGTKTQWREVYIDPSITGLETDNIHFMIPDEEIKFSGVSVALQDNLCIKFKCDRNLFTEVGYENPYVVVEMNGEEYTVSKYRIVDGEYVFDFTDITSANVNDVVKATLCAMYADTVYQSEPLEYSLATYCNDEGHTWRDGTCLVCGEDCEHSYTDDTCTICGKVKNYDSDFAGASITLGGNIGVNFYYDISDDILADKDAVVRFIVPDTGSTYTVDIPVSDGEWDGDLGLHKFTCDVAAKEMTSVIKAQVITSLAETEVVEYSVYDYALHMLEHSENYAAEQDLIKALLNYGAASQLYFSYNTDNLANDILDEADKVIGTYNFEDFSSVFMGEDANISYYGSSLSLKSETAIKHYFIVKDDSSMPEFKVNGEVVEAVKNGNFYEVKITEISAHNLDEIFTVEAGDFKIEYGVFSYAYQAMKTDKETLKNAVNALYTYNMAADVYLNAENR